jgi:hypothetical protein
MGKPYVLVLTFSALLILLSACGGGTDQAAAAVEGYLTALVGKDSDTISSLSCADWELQALLELDSFQAVETRLEGMDAHPSRKRMGPVLSTAQAISWQRIPARSRNSTCPVERMLWLSRAVSTWFAVIDEIHFFA